MIFKLKSYKIVKKVTKSLSDKKSQPRGKKDTKM